MRYLVALTALLIVAAVYAQPPQAPRRPAQAPGVCQCTGKGDCTCDPLACFCRACSGRKTEAGVYTATLSMSRTVEAGSYSGPFGRVSGTFDQDVPAGTYRVTLTPIGTAAPPVVQHDPTVIHLDPQTGRRWRYTPEGPWTWDYLPEMAAPQYTQPFVPQTFAPSFAAMRGGSC